jgi:hypothetical protein
MEKLHRKIEVWRQKQNSIWFKIGF